MPATVVVKRSIDEGHRKFLFRLAFARPFFGRVFRLVFPGGGGRFGSLVPLRYFPPSPSMRVGAPEGGVPILMCFCRLLFLRGRFWGWATLFSARARGLGIAEDGWISRDSAGIGPTDLRRKVFGRSLARMQARAPRWLSGLYGQGRTTKRGMAWREVLKERWASRRHDERMAEWMATKGEGKEGEGNAAATTAEGAETGESTVGGNGNRQDAAGGG